MQIVLVTGGAGTLGRLVATHLSEAGYHVRAMSRHGAPDNALSGTEWARADLETGAGLAEAVQGVDVIVHTASSPFKHMQQVDVEGTRRLLEQARATAVSRVVYISIVGIDRIPFAYYQSKLYVCTFEKEVAGKDTMWYQEEETTLETMEVSDASTYYMPG